MILSLTIRFFHNMSSIWEKKKKDKEINWEMEIGEQRERRTHYHYISWFMIHDQGWKTFFISVLLCM